MTGDPLLAELMDEAGVDEGWLARQPEPTADCASDTDHYGTLLTFGRCPNCNAGEVA